MRKLPFIAFLLLLVMAVTSSMVSYDRTRQCIDEELDHALSLTIRAKGFERMKQDSIRAYRLLATPSSERKMLTVDDPVFQRHIRTEALRSKAFIAYHITPQNGFFDVKMEGKANCSMAFVFGLSDQRLALLFAMAALLSLLFTFRKETSRQVALSPMPLHLTPMQEQLMDMFLKAPDHRLTKQEICDAFWPHKDNAAETLYTTIRRLRNELEAASGWEIVSERGKSYELRRTSVSRP